MIRMKMKGFKAQFWSLDAIFAVVIFLAAMAILTITWFNVSSQLALATSGNSYIMQLQAQQVAQNLLSTGSPANWQFVVNPASVSTWSGVGAGLASSQGSSSLSPAKLYALQSMVNYNYSDAGPALGTTFNYYITILGGPYNITMGSNPNTGNSLTTFVSKKSAFINGVGVQIQVFIWSGSISSVS